MVDESPNTENGDTNTKSSPEPGLMFTSPFYKSSEPTTENNLNAVSRCDCRKSDKEDRTQ